MNRVPVRDHQRDASALSCRPVLRRGLPDVAGRAQANRIVADRAHDHRDVRRRAQLGILPLQDRADHVARDRSAQRPVLSEVVIQEVGRTRVPRIDRGFVRGAGDRAHAVALVEPQPRRVLPQRFGIGAERRVIGERFQENADRSQRDRLVAGALIQRAADAAARALARRRDEVEVAEVQVGRVHQERESAYATAALGHEQDRPEVARRIA